MGESDPGREATSSDGVVPLVHPNPQKFVDIDRATEGDFQRATQPVYRSGENRSSIGLRILK